MNISTKLNSGKILLILTCFFFLLSSNKSIAGNEERAGRVFNAKKIMVYLWSKDQNFIGKGSNKDVIAYKNFIDSLNDVTKLISKNWLKDSEVEFEFKYLKEGKDKIREPIGTVIMFISYERLYTQMRGQESVTYNTVYSMKSGGSDVSNTVIKGESSGEVQASIVIKYMQKKNFAREIVRTVFNNIKITEANLKTALIHVKNDLKKMRMSRSLKKVEKKRYKDFSILKSKTLYISKKHIHKKMSINDVKSLYPYELKVIEDHKEFEKLIVSQKDAYFFIPKKEVTKVAKKSDYIYSIYEHCIYDYANEIIIGYSPAGMQGYFTRNKTPFLTKKSFKRFLKRIKKS